MDTLTAIKSKELYLELARNTGVFTNPEIISLSEELDCCGWDPAKHYIFFEEVCQGVPAGFSIIDKTELSEFVWDIDWLVVSKNFQGKGFGKRLLTRIEDFILQRQQCAILRLETSSLVEYTSARSLYIKQGYREVGRVPNFYAPYNDLITYSKEIQSAL